MSPVDIVAHRAGRDRRQRRRSPSRITCRPARWSRRCRSATSCLATKYPYGYSSASLPIFVTLPEHPARSRRAAAARRCRGVPLARRPLADLGQARRRPARRSHRDAKRTAVDQRRAGRPGGRRHRARPKRKTARGSRSARFIETLPGDRRHTIFKQHGVRPARQHAGSHRCRRTILFVMGDNRDNSADSRVPVDRRRRRAAARFGDLVGRVERAGRLVGFGRARRQPSVELAVGLAALAVLHRGS